MKIQINGEERAFESTPPSFTLAALVEMLGMKSDRVAVELNRDIVPRDRWAQTDLKDGDRVEVVHFVGGGWGVPGKISSLVEFDRMPCAARVLSRTQGSFDSDFVGFRRRKLRSG